MTARRLALLLSLPLSFLMPVSGRAAAPPAVRTDRYGDPLPRGAVARLGTPRLYHGGEIASIAVSPDGKVVASGGGCVCPWKFWAGNKMDDVFDRRICLWDAASGKKRWEVRGPTGVIDSLSFSPDGRTLAAAGAEEVRLYQAATGKQLRRWRHGGKDGAHVAFLPGGKLLAYADLRGFVYLYDLKSGKQVAVVRPWAAGGPPRVHGEATEGALQTVLAPDGRTAAWRVRRRIGQDPRDLCSWKNAVIRVRDVRTGKQLCEFEDPSTGRDPFAISPACGLLATAGEHIHLRDAATGAVRRTLVDNYRDAVSLTFSGDGKVLAAAHRWGLKVLLFDTHSGRQLGALEPPIREYSSLHGDVRLPTAFFPGGKTLAVGWNECIALLSCADGKDASSLSGHRGPVLDLHFSRDGRMLTSRCRRATCSWDLTGRNAHRRLECALRKPPEPEESPLPGRAHRRLFVSQDERGSLRLRETRTGKLLHKLASPNLASADGAVCDSRFSPDGKLLALFASQVIVITQACLYDTATGKPVSRVRIDSLSTWPVFSPSGKMLAWVGRNGAIHLADTKTGKRLRSFGGGPQDKELEEALMGELVVFSPGESYVAAAPAQYADGAPAALRVLHAETGQEAGRCPLPLREGEIRQTTCLAVSDDGRVLATGHDNSPDVHLWEVASGRPRGRLRGHQGVVRSLAFSLNGAELASGSDDTTVLVWDLGGPKFAAADPGRRLRSAELESLWSDLGGDADRAWDAIRILSRCPRDGVPLLRARVKPVRAPRPGELARLMADLGGNEFAVRERASDQLEAFGDAVAPTLTRAVRTAKDAEVRKRAAHLLWLVRRSPSPHLLRQLRALEVLERAGIREARQVLRSLAAGAAEARLTQEARAALQRLARQATSAR
jgi:WD40 repeat protein